MRKITAPRLTCRKYVFLNELAPLAHLSTLSQTLSKIKFHGGEKLPQEVCVT